MTTTGTTTPAFASCEALFTANPDMVADEGDAGAVMPVIVAGRRFRLVRHDTVMGIFYRLYPPDDDLAILTIARDNSVSGEIAQDLASAVVR